MKECKDVLNTSWWNTVVWKLSDRQFDRIYWNYSRNCRSPN